MQEQYGEAKNLGIGRNVRQPQSRDLARPQQQHDGGAAHEGRADGDGRETGAPRRDAVTRARRKADTYGGSKANAQRDHESE